MPVFNGMPWLPEAVESVFRQGPPEDVELIVLDGGSSDGSREWLEANASTRAELVFETDNGQTDALIKGFARASRAVLGWLNADDILEAGTLRRVSKIFATNPDVSVISGACIEIDLAGNVIGQIPTPPSPDLQALLRHPHNLAQPATFFTAAAYRASGGLDPSLHLAMDVDLWMKLAAVGRIVLLPDEVLARFRIHAAAKSVAGATAAVREDLRVRRRHGMPIRSRAWWVLFKRAYLRPMKRLRLR